MEYIIETKKLTKTYGTFPAVNNVSIHIPKGKIYGLLGRNGAGKTTLMSMLLNLTYKTSGEIKLFGKNINDNMKESYSKIGSIIESPGFYGNLTGKENLKILAKLRGLKNKDSAENALKIVGLENEVKKTFSQYSLGMKQRLGIAAAVMHNPELLILDEPINGLDPVGIAIVRDYLEKLSKEKGVTILISSHILGEIEQLADVIGVMNCGNLIEEVTMNELHKRCNKYIEFCVSNLEAATKLLNECYQITNYSVSNNILRIYDTTYKSEDINKTFVENGLLVSKINIKEDSLEEYFSKLIGGNGIA